jgi:hypothetical protein
VSEPKAPRRRPLLKAIDFRLSEILRYDFFAGVLGAIGGAIRWANQPFDTAALIGATAGVVGVVIGSVIAAAALQAAFMDRGFLLKLHYLKREPTYFLAPALFTAVLGVCAALSMIVLLALPIDVPTSVAAIAGGVAGFFAVYAIVSLIPVLRMIVEFTDLKATAALIKDDDPSIQP